MKCERCQGLGTIVLEPTAIHDDGRDHDGAVIALCPSCRGSGLAAIARRGFVHKPAARRLARTA